MSESLPEMSRVEFDRITERVVRRDQLTRRWRRTFLGWVAVGTLLLVGACAAGPTFNALARQALQQRDSELAHFWLRWSTRLRVDDASTALLDARAHRRQGDMTAAGAALERARRMRAIPAQIQLERVLAMAQSGQLRETEPLLPRMLATSGEDAPEICEAFVLGYMRNDRHGDALTLLQAWIADWPQEAYPLVLRGRIRKLLAQFREAEVDFRKAVKLDPSNLEATYELAAALQRENRPEAAIPLFERAAVDAHWGLRARLGLAECFKALSHHAKVRPLLEQAVREAPRDREALRELGRLEFEEGRFGEAVKVLKLAVDVAPFDDEIHFLLAQSLQSQGLVDEARPHFDYVERARAAFRELRLLQDSLTKSPGDTKILARIGTILLQYSEPEEGVVRLLAALDRNPDDIESRKLLINYYEQRSLEQPKFQQLLDYHRAALAGTATRETK